MDNFQQQKLLIPYPMMNNYASLLIFSCNGTTTESLTYLYVFLTLA
jgi:hypothetical protein